MDVHEISVTFYVPSVISAEKFIQGFNVDKISGAVGFPVALGTPSGVVIPACWPVREQSPPGDVRQEDEEVPEVSEA